jgi:thiosulfate/3-mercaptopyruvate sulfurtransferase
MPQRILPILTETDQLQRELHNAQLRIFYNGGHETFLQGHIPGAIWLDSGRLNEGEKPISGLLPSAESLQQLFREVGLGQDEQVLCYDDNGGTTAARCFWVLEAMGHNPVSFLNGGLGAWLAAGGETSLEINAQEASQWKAKPDPNVFADKAQVLQAIDDPAVQILDTRSPEEFQGLKSASARKGRIPGAVNVNWLDTVDPRNLNRFKPADVLHAMLQQQGIAPNNEVIAHCQTHQRSSHSYVMLRNLGYEKVRGYAGAWSEWAADPQLPIETG